MERVLGQKPDTNLWLTLDKSHYFVTVFSIVKVWLKKQTNSPSSHIGLMWKADELVTVPVLSMKRKP